MFLDATFTSKVHRKRCGVGLSQASFLKNLIFDWIGDGFAWRVIHRLKYSAPHF
jgi:hypothetical protein